MKARDSWGTMHEPSPGPNDVYCVDWNMILSNGVRATFTRFCHEGRIEYSDIRSGGKWHPKSFLEGFEVEIEKDILDNWEQ